MDEIKAKMARTVTDKWFLDLLEGDGGTFYPDSLESVGDMPVYFVSVAGLGRHIPIPKLKKQVVERYLEERAPVFESTPGIFYFGFWIDKGKGYLDVSKAFDDFKEAMDFAIEGKEIAIWDNITKREIRVDDYLAGKYDVDGNEVDEDIDEISAPQIDKEGGLTFISEKLRTGDDPEVIQELRAARDEWEEGTRGILPKVESDGVTFFFDDGTNQKVRFVTDMDQSPRAFEESGEGIVYDRGKIRDVGNDIDIKDVRRGYPVGQTRGNDIVEHIRELVSLQFVAEEFIPLIVEEYERWQAKGDPTKEPKVGTERITFFYNGYVRKAPINDMGENSNIEEDLRANAEWDEDDPPIARMQLEPNMVLMQEEVEPISGDDPDYDRFMDEWEDVVTDVPQFGRGRGTTPDGKPELLFYDSIVPRMGSTKSSLVWSE